MKSLVNRILRRVGFEVRRYQPAGNSGEWVPSDVSESDRTIIAKVRPYTVTSVQRLIALIDAVRTLSGHVPAPAVSAESHLSSNLAVHLL